ncbi:MAG: hypothetical protein MJ112_05950 [Lachnospiraceae bacterium]|nr:hypothetical protein [Lachnospiraceae bacterium]
MKYKKIIIMISVAIVIVVTAVIVGYLYNDKSKVKLRPIIEKAELSSLWGRNWQEWTLEDYISEFNLEKVSNYQWINNEADYYDAYFYNDVASLTWSPKDAPVHPVKGITINADGSKVFTYNFWKGNNIEDDFSKYFKDNSLMSRHDALQYFGIDEASASNVINTDCGEATVTYDDHSITVNVLADGEALTIIFNYQGADCSVTVM